jgi:hypothetical protein
MTTATPFARCNAQPGPCPDCGNTRTHNRCLQCGTCLPPSGPFSHRHARHYGTEATRANRRYCSNACRQAAYRQRHRDRTNPPPPVFLADGHRAQKTESGA